MAAPTRTTLAALTATFFLLSCTLGAALTPRATDTPTQEPTTSPQPSLTPTLAVDTPVPSATIDPDSPEYWACKMRSQVPNNGAKFAPKERFDAAWQVENHGYANWEPETIRVAYFSGTRMQVNDTIRLKGTVPSDRYTQFVVPMVAPRAAGRYSTVWALWYGDKDFCHMSLSIVVK